MKNIYVGIDLSLTGSAIVIIDEKFKIIHQELISTKPNKREFDSELRIVEIANKIINIIKTVKDKRFPMTCVEDISFGSKGQGVSQLSALNYYVRIKFLEEKLPFMMIPPTVLKKFVSGKGNSQKALMLKETYKKWGVDFDNDNLCDAYGLARLSYEKK